MSKQEAQEKDLSTELITQQLGESRAQIRRMIAKDIPKDIKLIRSMAPTADSNRQILEATVMTYLLDMAKVLQRSLSALEEMAGFQSDIGVWCNDISDQIDEMGDEIDDLQGGGGAVLSRPDCDLMMRVAADAKLLAGECLKSTSDEKGKEALANLMLECDKQLRILKEATITELEELEDGAPVDDDDDDDEDMS